MPLDEDQKSFIAHKVIELGSIAAVEEFYCNKDKVGQYAKRLAKKEFKPIRKRLKIKKGG